MILRLKNQKSKKMNLTLYYNPSVDILLVNNSIIYFSLSLYSLNDGKNET